MVVIGESSSCCCAVHFASRLSSRTHQSAQSGTPENRHRCRIHNTDVQKHLTCNRVLRLDAGRRDEGAREEGKLEDMQQVEGIKNPLWD